MPVPETTPKNPRADTVLARFQLEMATPIPPCMIFGSSIKFQRDKRFHSFSILLGLVLIVKPFYYRSMMPELAYNEAG